MGEGSYLKYTILTGLNIFKRTNHSDEFACLKIMCDNKHWISLYNCRRYNHVQKIEIDY